MTPRDALPFLEAEPPPVVVRGLANLLVLLFIVAVILSVAIRLPVTVTGRFVLAPVRGADPVRAPRAGIVAEVSAVEGAVVAKGAPLFRVRSELAGDRAGEAATLEIGIRGAEARIRNERARSESQDEGDRAERRSLGRQAAALGREIALAEKKVALAGQLIERARAAYAERLVAQEVVQSKELEATNAEMELVRLRTEQDRARAGVERLGHETEVRARALVETERGLREEAERARVRLSTMESAPVSSSGNELVIPAPCAGTVVKLHVRASAAVVAEGDPLGEVVCADEELRAEVAVLDNGMGLVQPGQRVKLFYDAFPYQRHGVRYATVRWLGPAGATRPDAPAFRVLAELGDRELRIHGAPYRLLPGMTGTAEIIVAEQSAVAYVLEPVRALRERMDRGP